MAQMAHSVGFSHFSHDMVIGSCGILGCCWRLRCGTCADTVSAEGAATSNLCRLLDATGLES